MKNQNIFESVIGGCVIVFSILFLWMAYSATDRQIVKTYFLSAIFDRIDGLNLRNDVKLGGVKVGYVESFEVDPNSYRVNVIFRIKDHIKIPIDSRAEIISESLLGGKYLNLIPGADLSFLKEGNIISQTQSALNFEALISKFLFLSTEDKPPKK